jgi:hypothetical protein
VKVFAVLLRVPFVLPLAVAAVEGGGSLEPPAGAPPAQAVVIPDPEPKPGYHCWEPHVAVDPEDPRRVVLTAMYRGTLGEGERARGDSRLYAWRSEDGGQRWSEPAAPFVGPGQPAGRIGADPVVAFGPGRDCWLVGCDYDFPDGGRPGYTSIKVSRSGDGGRTWQPPVTVTELANDTGGKGVLDKPWLAVDAGAGPRKGTLYVAWTRLDIGSSPGRAELWCAARPPGARAFTPAVRLGEAMELRHLNDAVHQVQLAVRPDGTLDAVWRQAPTGHILHASSADGAKTFAAPMAISRDEAAGTGRCPSLVATPNGGLLAAWESQGNVFGAVLESGKWTRPRPVGGEPRPGVRLSHPAVAATAEALFALAYRREPDRVCVAVYRSTDQGATWEEHRRLDARGLEGGTRYAASPGDYVGLAAGKGSLYAAYVLPGAGREDDKPRLHVANCGGVPPGLKSRRAPT